MNEVHIVGLGLEPGNLGTEALNRIESARVLAGGRRLLEHFADHPAERLELAGDLTAWLDRVARAAATGPVVVLASGDPGFYGVAARVLDRLGPDHVVIHPNVTAVQAAMARLKMPWQDVICVSLHGRDDQALFQALMAGDNLAVYTDPVHSPDRIARSLLSRDQNGWLMHVLEDLGTTGERMGRYELEQAAGLDFSPLNVTVLIRTRRPAPLSLGLAEDQYVHEAGLITKAEVRCVALGRLDLRPEHTLWDLGAGCGSIGLEACLLVRRGRVVAVERRPERAEHIRANRRRFGAAILEVVHGELPQALDGLPDPDRIFIGGGGPVLTDIIRACAPRLPAEGRLVAAVVQLASLDRAREAMNREGLDVDVVQVQVGRTAPLGGDQYIKAQNPVWLVTGLKAAEKDPEHE
ncbi:MAG: precorrin-6y C5,15-methyltransferase (decarboxylating) subunit CbiE [Proteobacteria bacterium]|nr:precorrin-6y C5,15-methyltransferase (decarboxylating) subunit CbiE [Pseudomonadota bacterium]